MKIYIGNTGVLRYIEIIKKYNWGRVHLANAWRNPQEGVDWILDNGAYSCWVNNLPFNEEEFEKSIIKTEKSEYKPDFIICPDIVAGGLRSLEFSLSYFQKIPCSYDVYLAVQNGMDVKDIIYYIDMFEGLFVGGTLEWKLRTSKQWIDLAHSFNKKCHIGRVGTFKRLVWAKNMGADSIDSSTFVQAKPDMGFRRIKSAMLQKQLF